MDSWLWTTGLVSWSSVLLIMWLFNTFEPHHAGASLDPMSTELRVPPIIHQTYKNSSIPERWVDLQQTWLEFSSRNGYNYQFWSDKDNRNLIETDFPWFLETYDSYPKPIQRVDAARLFILYKFGGIYVDLDIGLNATCDHTIQKWRTVPVVFPLTTPVGFSNGFIMAERNHPLFLKMIGALSRSDPSWLHRIVPPYFRVLISTGPLFVTRQYHQYDHKEQVLSLTKEEYREQCLNHGIGNSWHEDDAPLIQFFSHFVVLFVLSGLFVLAIACFALHLHRAHSKSRSPLLLPVSHKAICKKREKREKGKE